MKNNQTRIAQLLGLRDSTKLVSYPETLRQAMDNAVEAFDALPPKKQVESVLQQSLLQMQAEYFRNADLEDLSMATGLPLETLRLMSEENLDYLIVNGNAEQDESLLAQKMLQQDLQNRELQEISKFLNVPLQELTNLPPYYQEQIWGSYAMENGITPDKTLRSTLMAFLEEGKQRS